MTSPNFIRPEDFWRTVGLRAQQTVVHLGCGPGFYLLPAAKIVGKGGKVIGVDILSNVLETVEKRAEHEGVGDIIQVIRANLESPQGSTLPEASADWVLLANIMHQSDPAKLLAEAHRIVKPTGTVIVAEWDTAATPLGPPAEARIPQTQVEQLAHAQGFTVTEQFHPSPYHFGLLLKPMA